MEMARDESERCGSIEVFASDEVFDTTSPGSN
jgi:hypothetical protein